MESLRAHYILLFGGLSEDGTGLKLEPIMPSEDRPRGPRGETAAGSSAFMAQFSAADGAVVSRYPLEAQSPCTRPATPGQKPLPSRRMVGGIVPLPPNAAALDIMRGGKSLARRKIPRKGPKVKLAWSLAQAPKGGKTTVKWSASHPERAPMLHTLCVIRDDGQWQPCAMPTELVEAEVDLGALPGGRIALGVQSTDGFNVVREPGEPSTRPARDCVPVILSPAAGAQPGGAAQVILHGYGYYPDSNTREDQWLTWSSDKSGELGSFAKRALPLPPGRHRITLSAGPPGRRGQASVDIDVPDGSLAAPTRGGQAPSR